MKLSQLNEALNPLARITDNREKIDTNELYGKTFTAIDYILTKDNKDKEFVVVRTKEQPNNFHFGGHIETKIFKMIEEDDELKTEFVLNGVKLHYELGRTREGQRITLVTVVD